MGKLKTNSLRVCISLAESSSDAHAIRGAAKEAIAACGKKERADDGTECNAITGTGRLAAHCSNELVTNKVNKCAARHRRHGSNNDPPFDARAENRIYE